ncbi:MAG: hypothetical protein R3C99_16390 [Pirellulaceae bacterium]
MDETSWQEFLATMRPVFGEQLAGEQLPEADEQAFEQTKKMFQTFKWAMAYVAPRGVGPTAFDLSERKQTQHRRRFYLLGQTLDGMQVYDARRAIQALRTLDDQDGVPLWLQSQRQMAGVTLYASLFEPRITRVDLHDLPRDHRNGPYFLNVSRILNMPQAVALAADRSKVVLYQSDKEGWQWPKTLAKQLSWDAKQLQIREAIPESKE